MPRPEPAGDWVPAVRIPRAWRAHFTSKINGRRYSLSIALPWRREGRPRMLVVLDGDNYFASVAEACRANRNAPDVVVLGVGYPRDPTFVRDTLAGRDPLPAWLLDQDPVWAAAQLARLKDLTLPASPDVLRAEAIPGFGPLDPREVGGLEAFLDVLAHEVRPRTADLIGVAPSQVTLFGHSLGGLAALHAALTRPQAFDSFVAASPSIWWADRAVLQREDAFGAALRAAAAGPRILLTVGALEEATPPNASGQEAAELGERIRRARLVGNAVDLAERLRRLRGPPGFHVAPCAVFPGVRHGLSVWPAIAAAVDFMDAREPSH